MSIKPPIKTGFVGLSANGWASTILAPTLLQNDNFLLTAVSTTSENSAKASAEKHSSSTHSVKSYYGSTTHIANDPNVDLFAVAISSQYHREALLPIIEAGKDFFIEWPAGKCTAETREFAEGARAKGLRTVVGTQGRQSAVMKKVKSIIASGKIGKISSSTLVGLVPRSVRFWGPEIDESKASITHDPTGGSTMIDIVLGHRLDILINLLGDFNSITATSTLIYPTAKIINTTGSIIEERPNTLPDHVAFSGMLDSGIWVNEVWRCGLPETPGRLSLSWEIDGEEGSIRLTDTAPNAAFTNLVDPKLYVNGELVEVESTGLPGMIAANWEEFAKGIEGTHPTNHDALKVHEVLDAINASIKERRQIDL